MGVSGWHESFEGEGTGGGKLIKKNTTDSVGKGGCLLAC